jgi:hypothetical protein
MIRTILNGIARIIDLMFGCRHGKQSWPRLSIKNGVVGQYTCCLDCGKVLPYTKSTFVNNVAIGETL